MQLTFTSRDEKRCFIVTIAAVGVVCRVSVVCVQVMNERGPKNYDEQEVLSTTSCCSAVRPHYELRRLNSNADGLDEQPTWQNGTRNQNETAARKKKLGRRL